MRLGLIVGTGLDQAGLLERASPQLVDTPYGQVPVQLGEVSGRQVALVRRHGTGHTIPPHRINYRANVLALKQLGAGAVLSTSAVGSLDLQMQPGHFCVPDDFIDWTRTRPATLYDGDDGRVIHTDFTEAYCPALRASLLRAAGAADVQCHSTGCYVCVEGPRYETPAEIRAFARLGGNLVGMTNATEAILCREAGICFATLALVTNMAAGIQASPLSHDEVSRLMKEHLPALAKILLTALQGVSHRRTCRCGSASA